MANVYGKCLSKPIISSDSDSNSIVRQISRHFHKQKIIGMDYNNDNGMETTNFNLSSPQGGGASGSQSTPSKTRRATEEQTLIPVTVKMILDHSNNMLEDGREPHHIKLVAAIKDVNKASTAYMYTVEDGSGA